MKKHLAMTVLLAALASGCGPNPKDDPSLRADVPAESAPASTPAKTFDAASTGSISGRILFEGEAPAPKKLAVQGNPECAVLHPGGNVMSEELIVNNGGLANAFVYVREGLEGVSFPPATEPLLITNSKCVYAPHVAGARVGQEVIFRNDDSTLHNIHAYPKANKAFNLGLPMVNMKQTKKFTSPEVMIPMKCDVHPWMLGYIGVLDHPCFAVSDAEGNFKIEGIPAGEYTIEVWHEKLGVQTRKVTIAAQGSASAEFKYSAPAA